MLCVVQIFTQEMLGDSIVIENDANELSALAESNCVGHHWSESPSSHSPENPNSAEFWQHSLSASEEALEVMGIEQQPCPDILVA